MTSLSGTVTRARAHRLWQPLAYLAVGGWNTFFGVGLFWLAYALWHDRIPYLILLLSCNILAITNAYIWYKLLVFRTRGNWLREYLRFYLVYGAAMLLGMGLVFVLVQVFGVHPVLANTVTTAVTVICSFFGHRHVSFAPRK